MMQNQQQKRDKSDTGDSAPFRAALHRPVVEASQITGAAEVAETPGVAQVAKETAENAVKASQIV